MALNADAKKTLLRKIPHGVFICGVAEGEEVNGFTASWVTQGSFEPPLVVMACWNRREDLVFHMCAAGGSCYSF